VDLGISDVARPRIDNVEQRIVFYALRSDTQGVVSMIEFVFLIASFVIVLVWLIFGGEGD
jgi:hypothetical protein